MAIEFNDVYISIVPEANLCSSEEIYRFVNESEEAASIRMPIVILDLKNTKEINSAGIAKILKLYKNLQGLKIKLYMMNLNADVEPILKNLLLTYLITKIESVKDLDL
ncbi:STAS domain-containing protein [Brachyspira sp. SAP_772]|uniref:STAS domain-containing protein n=1 Tax=Brachyspira sp. SAP_772 TaxID=2608385 RepID=UPI0012F4ECCC|nr:STAS domain-containing protein [Brachyspira sp. SAP_772]